MKTTDKINKNIRDSKFEILRIIAMILIVAHHFAIYGFELGKIETFSYNKIIVDILSLGGKLGVNLFILISAYFMVDSKFYLKKFIKIFGETWFYSIIILILFKTLLTPATYIGVKQIIKSIFPIIFGTYWFITDYILLMILSPFLNNLINSLEMKLFRKMLIILITLSVFISGTIPGTLGVISNSLIWFIILYLTVGYIKKYIDLTKNTLRINLLISIVTYLILIIIIILLNLLGHKLNNNVTILNNCTYFKKQNSVFIFVTSIELFLAFIKIPTCNNHFINKIASCTLGVYLIHDNEFMREYIWKTLFKNQSYYFSDNLFFYAIFAITTVYIICTIFDLIRQETIEKLYINITNNLYKKTEKYFNNFKTFIDIKLDIKKIL